MGAHAHARRSRPAPHEHAVGEHVDGGGRALGPVLEELRRHVRLRPAASVAITFSTGCWCCTLQAPPVLSPGFLKTLLQRRTVPTYAPTCMSPAYRTEPARSFGFRIRVRVTLPYPSFPWACEAPKCRT